MAEPVRLFVVAGEASGDQIGADLVQRLRARAAVSVAGVGGAELISEGLASLFPMDDLAVMGWGDVIKRLPLLLLRLRQTVSAILRQRPDIVVLIDSQVFSQMVATRVRRANPGLPLLLYVGPSVWGWRPERAIALRPLFDEVLAVLPFEPEVMQGLGGPPTSYVGHPALARNPMRTAQPDRGPVLLLPGSRAGELRRHLGLMGAIASSLASHPRVTGFIIPTPASQEHRVRDAVADWPIDVTVVSGAARAGAFQSAVAAVAKSGTITLELALSGVPLVATYVAEPRQYAHYQAAGAPRFSLPNIVLGRDVVPELLSLRRGEPDRLVVQLRRLLDEPQVATAQLQAFAQLRLLMEKGAPDAPLVDPAERVLAWVDQRLLIGS